MHDTEVTDELPVLYVELPAAVYTDPDRFEREMERVFGRSWLVAVPLAALPAEGGVPVVVGRRSIVVTRQGTEVRAFHNVCTHRGASVVEHRCDSPRLRCPYHGWTFGLDGQVVAIPGRHRFGEGLDEAACALAPVHTATWGGLVWVHFGEPDCSVEESLGGFADELGRYRMDLQRVFASRSEAVPLNWKAAVDAFNETYHVPFIHATTVGRLVNGKASWFRYAGRHSRMVVPVRQSLAAVQGRVEADAIATSPEAPEGKDLLPEQARDHCNYTLYPNVVLNLLPRWGVVLQFEPIEVGRTEIRAWMLADPPTSEKREHALEMQWQEFDKVVSEDVEAQTAIGLGMRSPAFRTVRLGGEEERLVHFHRHVDEALA